MVILSRVLPGSAADVAGLHVNDRIYRIAGHDFATSDEFRELMTTLAGSLELDVESHGQMRRVTLDLPPQAAPRLPLAAQRAVPTPTTSNRPARPAL